MDNKLQRVRDLMEGPLPSDFSIRTAANTNGIPTGKRIESLVIGFDPAQPELISRVWPYGDGFQTQVIHLGKHQALTNLSPDQMIILDHLRAVKRRNRNKPMPNKLIRHKLRQFNKTQ